MGEEVDYQAEAKQAQGQLEELYRKKGFPDVGISYKVEDGADTEFSRITFVIDEGDKALLRSVRFQGNTHFTEAQLRKEMETLDSSAQSVLDRVQDLHAKREELKTRIEQSITQPDRLEEALGLIRQYQEIDPSNEVVKTKSPFPPS